MQRGKGVATESTYWLTPEELAWLESFDDDGQPNHVPPGFVRDFQQYVNQGSDAAPYLVRLAAYQALSLAAGDGIVVRTWLSKNAVLHLNLYTLTVGQSTIGRKSHLLGIMESILPHGTDGTPVVRLLDDVSPEAMEQTLGRRGQQRKATLLRLDEIGPIMAAINDQRSWRYQLGRALLRHYDHSAISVERTDPNKSVEAPDGAYLGLFGATTPVQIEDTLTEEQVRDGLLPRFIVVNMDGAERGNTSTMVERRNALRDGRRSDRKPRERLTEHLAAISGPVRHMILSAYKRKDVMEHRLVMDFTEEAWERFSMIEAQVSGQAWATEDDAMAAIQSRAIWNLVKLAALARLSRHKGPLKRLELIELEDVLRATYIIESTLADTGAFVERVGLSQTTKTLKLAKEKLDQYRAFRTPSDFARTLGKKQKNLVNNFPGRALGVLQALVENGDAEGPPRANVAKGQKGPWYSLDKAEEVRNAST